MYLDVSFCQLVLITYLTFARARPRLIGIPIKGPINLAFSCAMLQFIFFSRVYEMTLLYSRIKYFKSSELPPTAARCLVATSFRRLWIYRAVRT